MRIIRIIQITSLIFISVLSLPASATPPETGKYNLIIPRNVASRFPGLENYNTELTQAGRNPQQFPVRVMRHHIIPRRILRDFLNRVFDNGDVHALRGFLRTFSDHVAGYFTHNGLSCEANVRNGLAARETMNMTDALLTGQIQPGGDTVPDGWDEVMQLYLWMPWNLFIGPRNRADDPEDRFEENVRYIIDDDDVFNDLRRLYNLILHYINSRQTSENRLRDLFEIDRIISRLSLRDTPYQLLPENWERTADGRYRIRHTSVVISTKTRSERSTNNGCEMESKHPVRALFLIRLLAIQNP